MAAEERLDWFPCEPGPLLGALAAMPSPKQLVYIIALLRIYESGGHCLDTLEAMSIRTRHNKRVVAEAMSELFREGRLIQTGAGFRNPKADKVIADSMALLKKRRSAGAEGGRRKSEKDKSNQTNAPSTATDLPRHGHGHLQLQEQDSLFPSGNRAPGKPAKPVKPLTELEIAKKELFERGKQILGPTSGGMIQSLLAVKHGNVALVRAAIEQASTMDNPRQYIGAIIRGGSNGKTESALGGFSGVGARLRQKIAAENADAGDDAAGGEPAHGR